MLLLLLLLLLLPVFYCSFPITTDKLTASSNACSRVMHVMAHCSFNLYLLSLLLLRCWCSPEVLDPATVCVAKLSVPAVHCLSLSADQLLLACAAGSIVQVFSLPNLLHHQSDAPLHSLDLGSALLQFSWCPDSSEREGLRYLALTADRVLLHGNLLSGTEAIAEQVSSVCWAPNGQHLAYSTGSKLVVTAPDWKDSAFNVNITELEGECELLVHAMLASCSAAGRR